MSTTPTDPFPAHLRTLREGAGLTVYALAKRAGLTPQFVARLEAGDRSPSWETACALADALGVPVGDFRAPPPGQKKSPKKS